MAILTVAQYRSMSETPDTPPTDETLQLALDRYTGLIEGFTGRSYAHESHCETHFDVGAGPLQLNVYPVTAITAITVDGEAGDASGYDVHLAAGLIYHAGTLYQRTVKVEYNAGWSDAPTEIKVVLCTLVQGYLSGASGGTNELQGARKETVMGVSSIDYGVPGQAFSNFGSPYAELGPYVSVLEKYRDPGMA
jgi:hypothetical protein